MLTKQSICPANSAPPVGPYSPAVRVGDFLYCSGQIPLDPVTGNLVATIDIRPQVEQSLRNVQALLEASGLTFANVVKATVFLTDMDNLARYREARNRFFDSVTPRAAPAVTLVEVSRLYGPDFLIEIEAIAAA